MTSKTELPAGENVSPVDEYVREHIVSGIVTISLVIFLWELYLTFRQAFLVFWGPLLSWEYGQKLTESCGLDPSNEIYVTAGCQTVKMIIFTILCDLPISIYETFVIEEKHKFNKQTAGFFIKDQLTKLIVSYVLIVPLICGIVWIIKNGGDYFILYLWIFTVVMSLVLMVIYPELIAPLFDKYTALPEGDLKVRIEALASSLGFPLYKLYVVEGSRRSSHSNAYLYGFYKYKRIVLFDTLVYEYQKKKADEEREKARVNGKEEVEEKEIPGCETDEIIAVLAHELGHWHHSHALKGFLYGQVIFLVNFVLFAQLLHYSPMYEGLGFTDSKPVFIGLLIVLNNILAPVNKSTLKKPRWRARLQRDSSRSLTQRRQPQQSHHHHQQHRHNNNNNNGAASVVVDRANDRCPQQRQRRTVADSNGYKYGSECDCCPYGYHIDVDFVRFCEDWQNAACDRLAEEKRRRRVKQKQRQSMEFMLGLPDEADASTTDADTSPPPSSEMRAVATSTPVERSSQAAAALAKTRQAPESTTVQSHKDWEDTLSNFEQTLSQSFSGPSRSSSMTSIASRCHRYAELYIYKLIYIYHSVRAVVCTTRTRRYCAPLTN
ncbi:unnamed protein product [Trichogramma brassicae]|uniref:Ste24 endopeptidase n=1 Tax=Trichogramma brassicae TaxID=86971 RepID=A0A6H5IMD9_9HYME|nr:unnamed protein product [Trichogramma brassicae]